MEAFIWSDKFSIDKEHQWLFTIYARLEDLIENNDDKKMMVSLLAEMADYAI